MQIQFSEQISHWNISSDKDKNCFLQLMQFVGLSDSARFGDLALFLRPRGAGEFEESACPALPILDLLREDLWEFCCDIFSCADK